MPAAARRSTPPARSVRAARAGHDAGEAKPARYGIGELAGAFGVTTRAIRFYEDCGILQPARAGRNRVYTARDRARLELTLRGKRLGLKLAEIKELVDMYESKRDTAAQLRRLLAMLARHRADLEQRLADLQANLGEVLAQETAAKKLLKTRQAA